MRLSGAHDAKLPDPYVSALPRPRPAEAAPVVEEPQSVLPAPRHAMDDVVVPDIVDNGFRPEVEALAMLSSLASDFDY